MRVDQFRTAINRIINGAWNAPPQINVYLANGRMLSGTPMPPDWNANLFPLSSDQHGEAEIDIEAIDALQEA